LKGVISLKDPSQVASIVEKEEATQDQAKLDQIRRKKGASASRSGKSRGKEKPGKKNNPGRKGTGKSVEMTIPAATVEVPPAAPVAIATAPASAVPAQTIPAEKKQEVTSVTVKNFKDIPANKIIQSGQLTLKSIMPQIQAVVDRVMNDIPAGLPEKTKVRKDFKRNRTIFSVPVENGTATLPVSITPSSWNMSLGIQKRAEERVAVCYLNNGKPTWLKKPYFTLNLMNREKQPLPPIDLFSFALTHGETQYAYILQINKGKEVLVTKWSLGLRDPQRAIRTREVLIHEQYPLQSKERTKAAMPVLLNSFAEIICELYDQLTATPPAKPDALPTS